jgi:hypothetical protein
MRLSKNIAAAALMLFIVVPASAQVVYTYQGNDFAAVSPPYTMAMSVAGSFQVAAPLPASATTNVAPIATAFNFFDGVEARTLADSTICEFSVTTNAVGQIVDWDILLREAGAADPQHSLETRLGTDLAGSVTPNAGCGAAALNPFASVTGLPGVWGGGPSTVDVPTASHTGLLVLALALALAAIVGLRLRS